LSNSEITSTDSELGPRVPTIFDIAAKKVCHNIQSNEKLGIRDSPYQIKAFKTTTWKKRTGLEGSRMEAILMGSSSSKLVEGMAARG